MARNYVGGESVRFTRADLCLVDMEYYDGRIERKLEPRRLFPITGSDKYISLLDKAGHERAIIRDVATLMPESRQVICEALEEYYLIPKITAVLDITEKFGAIKWTVDTECGRQTFRIQNRHSDVKVLYDGRVLIRDTNDNRYEIPDYTRLDKRSRRILNSQI